jgi:acyl-CoA reductase-like NAD-dependent aldehyde dehydrogenase
MKVVNPATLRAQAEAAIAAASRAFPTWAALTYAERCGKVRAFADAIEARAHEFSRLLRQENGKPTAQADQEIGHTLGALRYFADQEVRPKLRRGDVQRSARMRPRTRGASWPAARPSKAIASSSPTIVKDFPNDARLIREVQFGPVLPVIAYNDLDQASPLRTTPSGPAMFGAALRSLGTTLLSSLVRAYPADVGV